MLVLSETSWMWQLQEVANLLATVPGLIAATLLGTLFFLSFIPAGRSLVVIVLLVTVGFTIRDPVTFTPLPSPLVQLERAAELLGIVLLIFLLVPTLLSRSNLLHNPLLGAAVLYWMLEVAYALRNTASFSLGKGIASAGICSMLFFVFAYGLPQWLRSMKDAHGVLRLMTWATAIVMLLTLYAAVVKPASIVHSGRFMGITGNPQHAAVYFSVMLVPLCYMLSSRRESKATRIVWAAVTGLAVVFLIWTGSRTGFLTALAGIGLFFRARIGRFMGAAIIAAIFAVLFISAFPNSLGNSERLFSVQDTRSANWKSELNLFVSHPIFGVGTGASPVESSYITVASRLGCVGLILLGSMATLIVVSLQKLSRLKRALGDADDRLLLEAIGAGIGGIAVACLGEGALLGTTTLTVVSLYIFLGILRFLTDEASAAILESEIGQHTYYTGPASSTTFGIFDDGEWEINQSGAAAESGSPEHWSE